ncbi:MAG: 50S ribosomal protein L11 methyltransferase [Granulosicoccus sp.]
MVTCNDAHDDWLEVSVGCRQTDVEPLEDWLFSAGALSVTLSDGIDDEHLSHAVLEPGPGEVRLWDEVTLVGLFAQGRAEPEVHDALRLAASEHGISCPECRFRSLQDQVWERTWMDTFKPMRFGHRLWICPTQTDPVESEHVTIKLDPGMAFGTGTHATTAQCLEWLGEQTLTELQPLKGKTVIDFGCGSGVLAIASVLLGAAKAWAVDIDQQALLATRENAETNGVTAQINVGLPDILTDVKADIMLANILFQPLMELADTISACVQTGGCLVMSGILEEQMEPLRMRYNDAFNFTAGRASDGWALMTAIRR